MANDVSFQRAEYALALPDWQLAADACAGERAIKDKGETYLPKPNPNDRSEENDEFYKSCYLTRAVYYNVTGRTLQGLTGATFKSVPTLTVPTALKYVEKDVNGAGVSVYQQSQAALANVLQKGRHGLLVDYPPVEAPASLAQQQAGLIRANIISISAEQVINWRTEQVGGIHRLSLVVIAETVEEITPDGFGIEKVDQFRVLKLVSGQYVVELWRKDPKGEWYLLDVRAPTDGAGRPWDVIPFGFIGSENNDHNVDHAPLIDLAGLNIKHYRNSADYELSVFFVGQAQPWMSGLSEDWRDHLEKDGIYIGARTPILLPEGGAFGFAQAEPNTLVKEAMDAKEQQMVALGARLVQPGQAVKTATEAQSDNEAQHSVLSLCVSNVSEAYTQALKWAARFMNAPDAGIEYALNQQFTERTFDPQILTALVAAWQAGRVPSADLNNQLRKLGIIDPEKTDEEIKGELESESADLGLDDADSAPAKKPVKNGDPAKAA